MLPLRNDAQPLPSCLKTTCSHVDEFVYNISLFVHRCPPVR